MAAYNGQRFLRDQLESILPQLSAGDEMIFVDDRSTDGTLAVLKQFCSRCADTQGSPTTVLIEHSENRGVISTFEEALRAATGDILFLADDDDRWAPDKVSRVLAAFAEDDHLQLVSTGLEMIDEAGQPIPSSDFLRHRRFSVGIAANLLHNQFQGSTLALRSSALQYVLPFPTGKLFLHDAWIGLRVLLHGGKVRHLEQPLLLYRRHGANVSRRLSLGKQLNLRLQLVTVLLRTAFHRL